jgi:hypothetical protein
MKPKLRSEIIQLDLFQAQFDQLLNLSHPLCVLARIIDWQRFDVAFAGCDCPDTGAPGKDIRLLVGLVLSKNSSDVKRQRLYRFGVARVSHFHPN